MKILIIGGYGIFGGRLAQLLSERAELTLLIAGRSFTKAEEFCDLHLHQKSATPVVFDRDENMANALAKMDVDLVIDASGPFQSYGNDPYRVVKACITQKINYMDFSDASEFVKGIAQFDSAAKASNIFILSGVSSFPILTSAVVRKITVDFSSIDTIKGGIAPSPFAVVGLNVIKAITSYAGKPVKLVRNSQPAHGYGLLEHCRYTIAPKGCKPLKDVYFSLVDVPDLLVLPELWPSVKSVWMGAGPVPEVLHKMLKGFAWLVRIRCLPSLVFLAPIFHFVLNILRWGEHRGGMFVEVTGVDKHNRKIARSWQLVAEGEDGPYIPAMALQALVLKCLRGQSPESGARPGTLDLELEDYEALFAQRKIHTDIQDIVVQ